MKLAISNATGVPIYEQLKRQIKAAILVGELRGGEALPSLRTVARELRISVLTATRAYTELEQEGFVANVQGKGCYVREQDSALLREQFLRRAEEGLAEAIAASRQAGLSSQELHGMLDILLNQEHQGE
ncbi:MAG: GntR family transcriptional regulator [Candidatus Pelethousia sp.]|nr:GntR family transcriptional regulator [Candidatus Pelethousia sp.]